MPSNFYRVIREPRSTRKRAGTIKVQSYGVDAQNQLVCAGVHHVPSLSPKYAWRILASHLRWRKWYDRLPWNRNHDYPAKHNTPITFYGIHPIDDPKRMVWVRA